MTCRVDEDRFAAFDIVRKRRGRRSVRTTDGHAVMCGSECSRAGARYKAKRALFLLLCASVTRFSKLPLEAPHLVRGIARRSKDNRAALAALNVRCLGRRCGRRLLL
jgi:hypothetical protein